MHDAAKQVPPLRHWLFVKHVRPPPTPTPVLAAALPVRRWGDVCCWPRRGGCRASLASVFCGISSANELRRFVSAQTCQWSFRQIGTTGTLESRARPNTGVGKNFEIVHEKSCTSSRPKKMVRSAVHNALLNILTMETPLPCVPAAFQQCAVAEINSNRPPLGHKSDVLLLYRLNKYFCPSAKMLASWRV